MKTVAVLFAHRHSPYKRAAKQAKRAFQSRQYNLFERDGSAGSPCIPSCEAIGCQSVTGIS